MSCQGRQIFFWSHVENRVCFMFQIVYYPFLSLTIPFLPYSNRKKKRVTETETERGRGEEERKRERGVGGEEGRKEEKEIERERE